MPTQVLLTLTIRHIPPFWYISNPFFLKSCVNKNFALLWLTVPGYIIASVTAGAVSVAIAATVLTIYLKKSTNGELVQPYYYQGRQILYLLLYCIYGIIWLAISNTLNHRCRITWFWNTISNSAETVMARPIIRAKTWENGRMRETQDINHYHIQSIMILPMPNQIFFMYLKRYQTH